ncbi:MAG: phosphatase PAP2 family protein [Nitrospirae bacterium]|nr:phosphatase PAP2 family protein [Nitrospirota bacterium]
MLKSFFIPLLILLVLDNPIRDVIAYMKIPVLVTYMGWVSYLGKGWIQGVFCIVIMIIPHLLRAGGQTTIPSPLTGEGQGGGLTLSDAGRKGLYSVALAGIFVQAIKFLIGRPRPKIMDVVGFSLGPTIARGFDSFPSGHATSSFALASAMAPFFPRLKYPLYIYAILVSFSRIYINAHFTSDVFAGILLGLWIGKIVLNWGMEDIKTFIKGNGAVIGIAALTFFLLFYNLGTPGLFDVDEAVYAETAREMAESGDLITPHYNYTSSFDKPAMIYWLISSAFKLFGVNEFAARFWPAVFGLALVLMTYYFVKLIGNHLWGVLSALILATSIEVIVLSHASITDMPLTLFITASLFCFFLGYIEQEEGGNPHEPVFTKGDENGSILRQLNMTQPYPHPDPLPEGEDAMIPSPSRGGLGWGWGDFRTCHKHWWYRCFFLFAGLSVLTKGPVGLVIPGMIIFIFLLIRGHIKKVLKEIGLTSGVIIFLFASLPWYVMQIWVNGFGFISEFLIKHNLTRFTGVVSGHRGAFYYFIPVVLVGFFPWSAFLPSALINAFRKVRQRDVFNYRDSVVLFTAIWFLAVFVFFSISKTKLPGYILPLAPALAILVGRLWEGYIASGNNPIPTLTLPLKGRGRNIAPSPLRGEGQGEGWFKASAIFCIILGITIAAGLIYLPTHLTTAPSLSKYIFEPLEGQGIFYIIVGIIILSMVLFTVSFRTLHKNISFGILVMMMTITTFLLLNRIVPIADKYLQAPLREFAITAGAMSEKENGEVAVYALNKPSIVFYSRQHVVEFKAGQKEQLSEAIASQKRLFIITKDANSDWLLKKPNVFVMGQKGGYVLLSNQR